MNKAPLQNRTDIISKWETPRLSNNALDDKPEHKDEEELRLAAHKEGFDQGYHAGLTQGTQEMEQRLRTIDNFISALSQPFNDQNFQLAEDIAELAGKIAKSLVRRELRTEPETIMALVHDTITALNTRVQTVNVHLHPDNARLIRELVNIDSPEQSWNIIDDPLVARSDCKVSSRDALIDADLQKRINLIITQFMGDERSETRK